MVKIRLSRLGKKRKPAYRIVVMDTRVRRDGKPLEQVGFYDPISNEIKLSPEAIKRRLQQGAQVSPVVRNILVKAKIM
jgi:small subunit ribosomal protein S16